MAQVSDLWLLNRIIGQSEEDENQPMIFRDDVRREPPAPIPPDVAKAVAPPLDTSTPIREPDDFDFEGGTSSGGPTIETVVDPATGREYKFMKTPRGLVPSQGQTTEEREPTWPPKPVAKHEALPGSKTPARKVGEIPAEDPELLAAQEADQTGRSLTGIGRMLYSGAMDLAGVKRPDMSFFDASEANAAGNADRLEARRKALREGQDQRIQELGAQRLEDQHASRQDLDDPSSTISRVLQDFAVEQGILSPEDAPQYPASAFGDIANMLNLRIRSERPAGSGKSEAQQAFDNYIKLEDLKTKKGFSEAMQGFKDNARDALALRYSSQMIGGDQWIAQPGKVTSANDQKKFAEVLTQHGKIADSIAHIEEIYKNFGPEWILGEGRQVMETNIGLLRNMINVATGQGAISGRDGEALQKMIPDQNRLAHIVSSGDFLRALDQIKRFSFSAVRHTARDYGFLHVRDPAAAGLKNLTTNTTFGPIQVPISTPGGKLQPPDPEGAHAYDGGGSRYSYTRTSTSEPAPAQTGVRVRRLSDGLVKTVRPDLAERLLRDPNKFVRVD